MNSYISGFAQAGLLTSVLICNAVASEPVGCTSKHEQVLRQLDYALAHNNTQQIAGLQKALNEINANCTDEKLLVKRSEKDAEKQRKIEKLQRELEQAKVSGNHEKIASKQHKLNEAQDEPAHARRNRD